MTQEAKRAATLAAVSALDPAHGDWPIRQVDGPAERVLHLHLTSRVDQQPSQVRALAALGQAGYVKVPARAPDTEALALQAAEKLRPSVVFVQIQRPYYSASFYPKLREAANNPDLVICNWSGDCSQRNAPSVHALGWAIQQAQEGVDLTLWSSFTHVRLLRAANVPSAYLQIGYDEEFFFEGSDEEWGTQFDVAFLYREYPQRIRKSFSEHDDSFARTDVAGTIQRVFGSRATAGATHPNLVDAGNAYRKAYVALSVSAVHTYERCTSDRLFRAMACTTTAVKRFADCESFGLKHEENCLLFDSTAELMDLLNRWIAKGNLPRLREIGHEGAKLVRENHTWTVRVRELRPLIAAVRSAR